MRFLVSQVRVRFSGSKEGICSKSVRNVGTSSTVFATTERTRRNWGLEELEEILAVTSESRRLGERLKATTGKCARKNVFAAVRRKQQIVMFFDDVRDVRKRWIEGSYKWYTFRFVDVFGL